MRAAQQPLQPASGAGVASDFEQVVNAARG